MARKGGGRHLKRLAAPRAIKIKRKEGKKRFFINPSPGPHPKDRCIPLGAIIRDYLGYAKTLREAKKILNLGYVLVDNKVRKDYKFPVGLMDVLSIPKVKEYYRVTLDDKNRLILIPIEKEETKFKICRVIRKTYNKGKKIQITLHDGRNFLFNEEEGNKIKVGDSLLIDTVNNKVEKILKFKTGNTVFIIGGRNVGKIGKIASDIIRRGVRDRIVLVETEDKKIEVPFEYLLVVGEDKPLLTIRK